MLSGFTRLAATVFLAFAPLGACAPFIGCIREGELIETTSGERPVESLRIGDEVPTCAGVGRVERIAEHEVSGFEEVRFSDGHVLRATAQHPVASGAAFVPAGSLWVGQRVQVRKGEAAVVSLTARREHARVFDVTVWPGETFFASGVLVHNKTVPRPLEEPDLQGTWVAVSPSGVWRLQLDGGRNGGGSLVQAVGGSVVERARVSSVQFNEAKRSTTVTVDYPDQGHGASTRTLQLSGYRGAASLTGLLVYPHDAGRADLYFIRESLLQQSLNEAQSVPSKND
jgi:hypothetical protein